MVKSCSASAWFVSNVESGFCNLERKEQLKCDVLRTAFSAATIETTDFKSLAQLGKCKNSRQHLRFQAHEFRKKLLHSRLIDFRFFLLANSVQASSLEPD